MKINILMDNIDGSYQQWLLYLQNYDDECDIYWNQRKYLYKTSGYIDPYLDNKVFYDGQFWESTKDYHNAYLDNKTSNDRHFVDNTTGYDGMYLINTAWNNEVHPCNITAYCTDCCHNHMAFYEDLMNNDEPNRETANYTRDLWPPLSLPIRASYRRYDPFTKQEDVPTFENIGYEKKNRKQWILAFCCIFSLVLMLAIVPIIILGILSSEDKSGELYVKTVMSITVNKTYDRSLSYTNSNQYKAFTTEFCFEIGKAFPRWQTLGNGYYGCMVNGLREGSVIISFYLYFTGTAKSEIETGVGNIINTFLSSSNHKLGSLNLKPQSLLVHNVESDLFGVPPSILGGIKSDTSTAASTNKAPNATLSISTMGTSRGTSSKTTVTSTTRSTISSTETIKETSTIDTGSASSKSVSNFETPTSNGTSDELSTESSSLHIWTTHSTKAATFLTSSSSIESITNTITEETLPKISTKETPNFSSTMKSQFETVTVTANHILATKNTATYTTKEIQTESFTAESTKKRLTEPLKRETSTETSTTEIPTKTSTTERLTEPLRTETFTDTSTEIPTETSTTEIPTETSTTEIPTGTSTIAKIPTEASTTERLTEPSEAETFTETSTTERLTEPLKTETFTTEKLTTRRLIELSRTETSTKTSSEISTETSTTERLTEQLMTDTSTEIPTRETQTKTSTKQRLTEQSIRETSTETSLKERLTEQQMAEVSTKTSTTETPTETFTTKRLNEHSVTEMPVETAKTDMQTETSTKDMPIETSTPEMPIDTSTKELAIDTSTTGMPAETFTTKETRTKTTTKTQSEPPTMKTQTAELTTETKLQAKDSTYFLSTLSSTFEKSTSEKLAKYLTTDRLNESFTQVFTTVTSPKEIIYTSSTTEALRNSSVTKTSATEISNDALTDETNTVTREALTNSSMILETSTVIIYDETSNGLTILNISTTDSTDEFTTKPSTTNLTRETKSYLDNVTTTEFSTEMTTGTQTERFENISCTDIGRILLYSGPFQITCRISFSNYEYMDLYRTVGLNNFTYSAKIYKNGTIIIDKACSSSMTVMLQQETILVLNFENVSCEVNGVYHIDIFNSSGFEVANLELKVDIVGIPNREPTLILHPDQVEGSNTPWTFHSCEANIGFPPGDIEFEILKENENVFTPFKVDIFGVTDTIDDCLVMRRVQFRIKWNNDMDKAIVRCTVKNSYFPDDLEMYSNNETISLIPRDICKNNVGTSFQPHPTDCTSYVECYDETVYGRSCLPPGLCFGIESTNGCNHCGEVTCLRDVISSFEPTKMNPSTEKTPEQGIICNDKGVMVGTRMAEIICRLNVSSFDVINIAFTMANETAREHIAKIYDNNTIIYIEPSSKFFIEYQNDVVAIRILEIFCNSAGTFVITLYDKTTNIIETSAKFDVYSYAELPTLQNRFDLVENRESSITCKANIGNPPGQLQLFFRKQGHTEYIEWASGNVQMKDELCKKDATLTFQHDFTADWNNTEIRCVASSNDNLPQSALNSNLTSSETIVLIEENYCFNETNTYKYHPKGCGYYILCSDRLFAFSCGENTCYSFNSYSPCVHCNEAPYPCNKSFKNG